MAVVLGTNSGFVSSAPVADPAGGDAAIAGRCVGTKDTSPAGSNNVTELGAWLDSQVPNAGEVWIGLYSDDAADPENNVPNAPLVSGHTHFDGSDRWYIVSGLSYSLTASTAHWVVTACPEEGDAYNYGSSGGVRLVVDVDQPTLPVHYTHSPDVNLADYMAAFYALYVAAGGGRTTKNTDCCSLGTAFGMAFGMKRYR